MKRQSKISQTVGLTVHESMACRVANAVPNHSAFTDWPKNGVEYIELSDIIQTSVQGVNTFGWVPSKQSTIDALEKLYQDETYRKDLARKGYRIATKTEHDWKNIAKQFSSVFKEVLARKKAE